MHEEDLGWGVLDVWRLISQRLSFTGLKDAVDHERGPLVIWVFGTGLYQIQASHSSLKEPEAYLDDITSPSDGAGLARAVAWLNEPKVRYGEIEETIKCFWLPFEEHCCDAVSEFADLMNTQPIIVGDGGIGENSWMSWDRAGRELDRGIDEEAGLWSACVREPRLPVVGRTKHDGVA